MTLVTELSIIRDLLLYNYTVRGIVQFRLQAKRGSEEDERKKEIEALIQQIAADNAMIQEYERRKAEPIKVVLLQNMSQSY